MAKSRGALEALPKGFSLFCFPPIAVLFRFKNSHVMQKNLCVAKAGALKVSPKSFSLFCFSPLRFHSVSKMAMLRRNTFAWQKPRGVKCFAKRFFIIFPSAACDFIPLQKWPDCAEEPLPPASRRRGFWQGFRRFLRRGETNVFTEIL